ARPRHDRGPVVPGGRAVSSTRVLVVEDDKAIARLVCDNLRFEGYDVEWRESGRGVFAAVDKFRPDLLLLDLALSDGVDGFELCQALTKRSSHLPIIIMPARGEPEDRVRGLTLGADDYIVKPFALQEMLARIRAVLRRARPAVDRLTLGGTTIDFRRRR